VESRNKNLIVLGLVSFGIFMRVLPYILNQFGLVSLTDASTFYWNVSPVPAMCLLGGAYLSSRWIGLGVGLIAYLISDILIGWVTGYPAFTFYRALPFVYAGFILHGMVGATLRAKVQHGRVNPLLVGLVAAASELVFFLVTNFGEWAVGDNGYAPNAAGLLTCYIAALPFFGRSLYGTVIYAVAFFELAGAAQRQLGTSQLVAVPVEKQDK
jgi:hypothetical protein